MADGIRSTGEFELSAVRAHKIVCFGLASVGGEIFVDVGEAEAGNGATDQSCNVRMFFSLALALQLALHVVGAASLSLGGGDEQVVALNSKRARIPLSRDHTERGLLEPGSRQRRRVLPFPRQGFSFSAQIEYDNGVERCNGCVQAASIRRKCHRQWAGSKDFAALVSRGDGPV